MSSRVILCQVKKAENPYYIEDINRCLYSIEELCWFVDHNLALAADGFFDATLTDWIRTELGLQDLADRMDRIMQGSGEEDAEEKQAAVGEDLPESAGRHGDNGSGQRDVRGDHTLEQLIDALNAEISWIYVKDRAAFRREIAELLHLLPGERMKRRADTLVGYGKYTRAIRVYKKILRDADEEVLPPETAAESSESTESKEGTSSDKTAAESEDGPALTEASETAEEVAETADTAHTAETAGTSETADAADAPESSETAGTPETEDAGAPEGAADVGPETETYEAAAVSGADEIHAEPEDAAENTGADSAEDEEGPGASAQKTEEAPAETPVSARHESEKEERIRKLKGTVWHNMGVACSRLFQFDEACDCLKKGYELLHNGESLRDYLYCVNISQGQETYNRLAEQYGVDPETKDEMDRSIASFRPPERPENDDEALNEWVRGYHRETAP